ncbi:MAG: hypothetical protein PHH36_04980 [Sideroxydans sp.]|nr:hypothetical protein [Sideroxydans sp.]
MKSCQWNASPRRKKQESVLTLLKKYMFEHLLGTITAIGSFFGGLFMLVYMLDEKFFPAGMEASSIGLLLGAAAIVGIVVSILFGLYFIIPGYVYKNMLAEEFRKNSIDIGASPEILRLLDAPAFVTAMFFGVYLYQASYQVPTPLSSGLWIVYFLLLILITMFCTYPRIDSAGRERIKGRRPLFFVFFISTILAALPWLLILQFASGYSRNGADDGNVWFAILLMVLAVVSSNHIVAGAKKWWVVLLGAVVALLFAIYITQQWSLIPRGVVRLLSIGNIPNATLLLDEQGCEIAAQYTTDQPVANPQKKMASCKLSSVTIVWRIGNEYWIKPQGAEGGNQAATSSGDAKQVLKSEKESKLQCVTEKYSNVNRTGKAQFTEQTIVEANDGAVCENHSKILYLNSNIKFSLPASHVLSWSIEFPSTPMAKQ